MKSAQSFFTFALLVSLLAGCGAGTQKKAPLTPEQMAQLQQQQLENKKKRKARNIKQARRLGLLEMSVDEKVAYMKNFLIRLRSKQVSGLCDVINDIAYSSENWLLARCKNGYEFAVHTGKDLLAMRLEYVQNRFGDLDPSTAVWFMQGQQYPESSEPESGQNQ